MIVAFAIGLAAVVFVGSVFLLGRAAGRNSVWWELEHDDQFRRQTLEQLAKQEGCRIVGRE